MAKKNHTKKALISSLLALFICFTMLIGTTFAWFTDTAVSSGNKIQAGTLKIDLLVKDGAEYTSVKDQPKAIFNYDKWEPGYVEYKNVKVSTDGNLALKYTMSIVPKDKEASKLAEVIDVYYDASEVAKGDRGLSGLTKLGTLKDVLDGAAGMIIEDTLIPVPKTGETANTEDFATIALKMQETAGNEYQGLAVGGDGGFDLFIQATQYTYEEDSFDDQYDKNAEFAALPNAYSVAELKAVLEAGEDVILGDNISIPKDEAGSNGYGATGISILNGQTFDGNGKKIGVVAWGTWDSAINTTGGTIKNVTVNSGMRGIFINHNSSYSDKVILENVIINGTVYTISCDQGTNKGLEATNCTFNGWTSYAATIGDVKFVDCDFGKGQGYAYCRPYAPTEFVGCNFAEGFTMEPLAACTFENCTLNGVAITTDNLNTLVISNIANATVK